MDFINKLANNELTIEDNKVSKLIDYYNYF